MPHSHNKLLNAVITFTDSLAAQQADAAVQLLAQRRQAPPCGGSSSAISLLAGMPFGLKDIVAVPGYATSWGLTALQERIIPTPAWAYTALAAAGGVLLAKTATGELAWGDSFFDGITTRNPWHVETGSCGSSSGSAVAVAAGAPQARRRPMRVRVRSASNAIPACCCCLLSLTQACCQWRWAQRRGAPWPGEGAAPQRRGTPASLLCLRS